MSLSNAAETAFLNLLFCNTDWANIGDASGLQNSASAGVFWISLHTANPNEGGSQNTSEAAYTSYARVSVARSGVGWTVSSANCSNAAAVTFPACTGSSADVTHFGIGTDETGAGNLIAWGALGATLSVTSGVTPSFAIGALDIDVD